VLVLVLVLVLELEDPESIEFQILFQGLR